MEQPGSPERALAPAAPYLAGFLAVYAALSGLTWLAGELAGWLWTRRWPPATGTDALAVLAYLSRDPAHPALAWPMAARHDLAPAPLFYALAVLLLAAVIVPAGRRALAYLRRGRPWLDPNPRRSGFATSTALTTLNSAPASERSRTRRCWRRARAPAWTWRRFSTALPRSSWSIQPARRKPARRRR